MSNEKPNYGKKIQLAEAQDMIYEYESLRDKTELKVRTEINKKEEQLKLQEFLKREGYNAFVFTKDLIMRFFDGSEEDDDFNPLASNYLVVILGAHKNAKEVNGKKFAAGSFTVLTAGCTRRTEKDEKGEEVIRFYPLSSLEPANEYPPETIIRLEPMGRNKFDGGFEFFQVV